MNRLLLVLALVACGHKADPTGAGSAVGSATASAGSAAYPEVFSSQPPHVTLDQPGTDPHAYAYAPVAGQRTVRLAFSSGPADMPKDEGLAIAVTLAWTTPAAAAKPYEFRVTESKAIPPKHAQGGEAAIIGGVGAMYSTIAGRVDVDAHGRGTLVRTTATLPTKPSLLWLLSSFIVPLPAEPIGLGGTWTATQPVSVDGQNGTSQRTYTVTAINGDALTVGVTGATRWGGGSDAVTEVVGGTLVVKASDVLAQSGHVKSSQDLGPIKAVVDITLAP